MLIHSLCRNHPSLSEDLIHMLIQGPQCCIWGFLNKNPSSAKKWSCSSSHGHMSPIPIHYYVNDSTGGGSRFPVLVTIWRNYLKEIELNSLDLLKPGLGWDIPLWIWTGCEPWFDSFSLPCCSKAESRLCCHTGATGATLARIFEGGQHFCQGGISQTCKHLLYGEEILQPLRAWCHRTCRWTLFCQKWRTEYMFCYC